MPLFNYFTIKRKTVVRVFLVAGFLFSLASSSTAASPNAAKDDPDVLARYESAAAKLERCRDLPPDPAKAKQVVQSLLSLSRTAPPELAGPVLEAACSGMIALGDNAGYTGTRSRLRDVGGFENEVLDICPECGGTGRSNAACSGCHGSGRCPIPNCNNGRRSVPKLGVVSCATCRGTGRCPDCGGNGKSQWRCSRCNGHPKSISREKAKAVFSSRVSDAIGECRKQVEEAREAARREEERIRKEKEEAERRERAEEENRRNEEFAKRQRERGLELVQGRWATPGSRFDIPLTVLQKLLNEGITMRRGPMDGEHGGLLCVDANNEVGCVIVSERQWHFVQEGEKYTFDTFRCGSYTYPTRNGQMNTIRLFATELETALEEMRSGKHSERFK